MIVISGIINATFGRARCFYKVSMCLSGVTAALGVPLDGSFSAILSASKGSPALLPPALPRDQP
jgi:hypothetical protein